MITADQIIAHGVGDYILQSDWMANEKTKRWWPALLHGVFAILPFLFLTQEPWKLAVMAFSHALIDRYRLIRYILWAKNQVLQPWGTYSTWESCKVTGYHESRPPWMAVWLMIIADNLCHIMFNGWIL